MKTCAMALRNIAEAADKLGDTLRDKVTVSYDPETKASGVGVRYKDKPNIFIRIHGRGNMSVQGNVDENTARKMLSEVESVLRTESVATGTSVENNR